MIVYLCSYDIDALPLAWPLTLQYFGGKIDAET